MGKIKRVSRVLDLGLGLIALATLAAVGAGLGLERELKAAPLGVQLGALGGLQGGRIWVAGPVVWAGPSDGVQVRLGLLLGLGGRDERFRLQLETVALATARLGARLYGGAGFGVVRVQSAQRATMAFPLLLVAGLRRPLALGEVAVEGLLMIPLPPDAGPWPTRLAAGVALSF